MSGRLTLGGMGETFGMKDAGTWRREGASLCLAWDAGNRRLNGCYVVLSGARRERTAPKRESSPGRGPGLLSIGKVGGG